MEVTELYQKQPPKPDAETLPETPSSLCEESAALWQAIVGDYQLEPHHLSILRTGLEAYSRAAKARDFLNENGVTYDDRFGQPKPRPECTIERDARSAFLKAMKQLGLEEPPADLSDFTYMNRPKAN